jgi:hypothetical protein
MTAIVLTHAQANFEQAILNAEADAVSSSDIYSWLRESGLPSEAAIRFKSLIEVTAEIGDRIISVGKIILIKIIEFVKAHPNLAVGLAIGAAIGALVSMIPFIGAFLVPIATVIGVTIGVLGGHRLDKWANGQDQKSGLIAVTQDLIEIAKVFFRLLSDIFNTTLSGQVLREA